MRGRADAPDANTEYLLYQTLVGIWPAAGGERPMPTVGQSARLASALAEYMLKAVREAKLRTSWTDPNEEYERALADFIARSCSTSSRRSAVPSRRSRRSSRASRRAGAWNALARIVLHLTSPGVPDIYQGDELWNFALVDPDNRRPVDFDVASALLDEIAKRYDALRAVARRVARGAGSNPDDDRLEAPRHLALAPAATERADAVRGRAPTSRSLCGGGARDNWSRSRGALGVDTRSSLRRG